MEALVGRERELAAIAGRLDAAVAGGAQVLLVEGEPGIGKTALVAEAAAEARARGWRVLAARADELAGRRSFGLVADALGLAEAAGGRAPAQPLARMGPTRADAEFSVSEGAIAALDAICAQGPALLLLEDLHWADRASLYVLRRLVRHTGDLALVIVGTLRPLPRPPELTALLADVGPGRCLPLRALSPPAVARLVAAAVGGEPGPQLRAQVGMAGGNPLFLLEMLDALRAVGALRPAGGRGGVDIATAARPPSLRVTMLHRLSFLPRETLRLLSLAAVLGARFRPGQLAELANRATGELVDPLRDALDSGLLVEDGPDLAFRHELVRDALYGDLPAGLRASLHRDAARLLRRAGGPAGLVAEHLLRGAEPGDAGAAAELQGLARELAETAPLSAVELLERAQVLAGPRSPLAPSLLSDRAVALLWAGRAEEGEAACKHALARLADSAERVPLHLCLADSLLHRGRVEALLAEVAGALGEAALDPRGRARLQGLAANARLFLGQLDAAQAQAEGVEAVGQALGDPALTVRALVVRALVADAAGRVAAAGEIAGRAVAVAGDDLSRALHESQPHLAQGMFLMEAGRFPDAVAVLHHGLRAHESLGARAMLPMNHVCLGFTHFWSGRWDDAVAEIETAIALAEETGTGWRAAGRGLRAAVAMAQGDLATAERWLDAADAELAAGEAPYRVPWLHWARALWQEAMGRPVTVLDALAADGITLATVGPTAVRLALAANRTELARSVTSALGALANMNSRLAGIAAARQCAEGLLARNAAMLARAADAYGRAGRPVGQALAAEAGSAIAADRTLAGELRAQALSIYRGLNATEFARRLGSARLPRRPAHGWGAITATELRVLRLVAERRTNAEIATALGLSRRTVETHVGHILAKTDLRSRLQLGEAATGRFGWRLRLEEAVQNRQQA